FFVAKKSFLEEFWPPLEQAENALSSIIIIRIFLCGRPVPSSTMWSWFPFESNKNKGSKPIALQTAKVN
uniref:Uncharacterized protein n=1 Tax=Romanomermis culicivorax TaxID=13658 RepID=A0A915KHN9_ROMCU